MSRLTFMDQLRDDAAAASNKVTNTQFMGAGHGARLRMGASANHWTQPNVSLNPDRPEQLSVLYVGHGGARIHLARGPRGRFQRDVIVSWKYMQQGQSNQLDLGMYYDMTLFTLGLWYRGLPVQKAADGSLDMDALSFVFGFGNRDFKMGYSYDITLTSWASSARQGRMNSA